MNYSIIDQIKAYYDKQYWEELEIQLRDIYIADTDVLYVIGVGDVAAVSFPSIDYQASIAQPFYLFLVFNGQVIKYAEHTFGSSLRCEIEQNDQEQVMETADEMLLLEFLRKLEVRLVDISAFLDVKRMEKFANMVYYKLEAKDKLVYVDYNGCFPSLPIKFEDQTLQKMTLQLLELRFKYGNATSIVVGIPQYYHVFTNKMLYPLEQSIKVLIYYFNEVYEILGCMQAAEFSSYESVADVLTSMLVNRHVLYLIMQSMESAPMYQMMVLLQAFYNYSMDNKNSRLPQLFADDYAILKGAFDCCDIRSALLGYAEVLKYRVQKECQFFYILYDKMAFCHYPAKRWRAYFKRCLKVNQSLGSDFAVNYGQKIVYFCLQTIPQAIYYAKTAVSALQYPESKMFIVYRIVFSYVDYFFTEIARYIFATLAYSCDIFNVEKYLASFSVRGEIHEVLELDNYLFRPIIEQYYYNPSFTGVLVALVLTHMHTYEYHYTMAEFETELDCRLNRKLNCCFERSTLSRFVPTQILAFHLLVVSTSLSEELLAILQTFLLEFRNLRIKDGAPYAELHFKAIQQTFERTKLTFAIFNAVVGYVNDTKAYSLTFEMQRNGRAFGTGKHPGIATIENPSVYETALIEVLYQHIAERSCTVEIAFAVDMIMLVHSSFYEHYKYLFYAILEGTDSYTQFQYYQQLAALFFLHDEAVYQAFLNKLAAVSEKQQLFVRHALVGNCEPTTAYLITNHRLVVRPVMRCFDLANEAFMAQTIQQHFERLAHALQTDVAQSQKFIAGIYHYRNEYFGQLLSRAMHKPYNYRNLSHIILFVRHILKTDLQNEALKRFILENQQLFAGYEPIRYVCLSITDLQFGCEQVLQNFCEEWSAGRLNAGFERALHETILRVRHVPPRASQHGVFTALGFERQSFVDSYLVYACEPEDSLRHCFRVEYEIRNTSVLFKTCFELLAMAELVSVRSSDVQKYTVIAKYAREVVALADQILRCRNRIIQLLSLYPVFYPVFMFYFIDLEEYLSRLAVQLTWTSFRAVYYCKDLLFAYTQCFEAVEFYYHRFAAIYRPFLQLKEHFGDADICFENRSTKLSFRYVYALLSKTTDVFTNRIYMHCDNFVNFGALLSRYLTTVPTFAFYFVCACMEQSKRQEFLRYCKIDDMQQMYSKFGRILSNSQAASVLKQRAQRYYQSFIDAQLAQWFADYVCKYVAVLLRNGDFDFRLDYQNDQYIIEPSSDRFAADIIAVIKAAYVSFIEQTKISSSPYAETRLLRFALWLRRWLGDEVARNIERIKLPKYAAKALQIRTNCIFVFQADQYAYKHLQALDSQIQQNIALIGTNRQGMSHFAETLQSISFLNATRLQHRIVTQFQAEELHAMNETRVLLAKYITELERIISVNSFADSQITQNIANIAFLAHVFNSTELLEALIYNFDKVFDFMDYAVSVLSGRQKMYFDMYFEYYVEKYYKNDEQFRIALHQLSDLAITKYNYQRVVINSQTQSIIAVIVMKCYYVEAQVQILKNQLISGSALHYFGELTYITDRYRTFQDMLMSSQALSEKLPDWQIELFSYLKMGCFFVDQFAKQLLGFPCEQIFLINENKDVFYFYAQESSIQTCVVQYLNGQLEKYNSAVNNALEIYITQLPASAVIEPGASTLHLYRTELLKSRISDLLFNADYAKSFNSALILSHGVLHNLVRRVEALLQIQTICVLDSSLPAYDLFTIRNFLDTCANMLTTYTYFLQTLYRFYNERVANLFYYNTTNSMTTIEMHLAEIVFLQGYFETVLHQRMTAQYHAQTLSFKQRADCRDILAYFHLSILAFKTYILPQIQTISEYKIDVRYIEFIEQPFSTVGEFLEELCSNMRFEATVTYFERFKLQHRRYYEYQVLLYRTQQIHTELFEICVSLIAGKPVNSLFQMFCTLKNIYRSIRAQVSQIDSSELNAALIIQGHDNLFSECKIMGLLATHLLSERQALEIMRTIDVFQDDYNMWRTLSSYRQSQPVYNRKNGPSKRFVQSIFEFYAQNSQTKLYNVEFINMRLERDKNTQIELPLFSYLCCGSYLMPSINPLAHVVNNDLAFESSDAFQCLGSTLSKALEPEFCGFCSNICPTENYFGNELTNEPIFKPSTETIECTGYYDTLLFALSSLIRCVRAAHLSWASFISRSRGRCGLCGISSLQAAVSRGSSNAFNPVNELRDLHRCFDGIRDVFSSFFETYAYYYGIAHRITVDQFLQLYQLEIETREMAYEAYTQYIGSNNFIIKLPETQPYKQPNKLLQKLLGIYLIAYITDGTHILGLELESHKAILFKNRILLRHNQRNLSIPFLANFIVCEYENTSSAIRIVQFHNVGVVRPDNFAYYLNKAVGDRIASVNMRNAPAIANLLTSLADAEANLLDANCNYALFYDFEHYFPKHPMHKIDYDEVYSLPNALFYYLCIALLTLRVAAQILSPTTAVQYKYAADTADFISAMEMRSASRDDIGRQYFVKIIKYQLVLLNYKQASEILPFVEALQHQIAQVYKIPLFAKQIAGQVQNLLRNSQYDENFADIYTIQAIYEGGKLRERLLDKLDSLEQYVRKAFIIHYLAYELSTSYHKNFIILGYFEKIPSISYTQYFRIYQHEDNVKYELPNEFIDAGYSWRIESSNIMSTQFHFDSPFYCFRPFVYEDRGAVCYYEDSFQYILNNQGSISLAYCASQHIEFPNYSGIDIYKSFYTLHSITRKSAFVALNGINEISALMLANLLGLPLVFVHLVGKPSHTYSFENAIVIFYEESGNADYFNSLTLKTASTSQINIIVAEHTFEYLQCSDVLLIEQDTVKQLTIAMDYKEYASKIMVRYLSIVTGLSRDELLLRLKPQLDQMHKCDFDQLLLNLESFGSILRAMQQRFDMTVETERIFYIAYLLASQQYAQLIEYIAELRSGQMFSFFAYLQAYYEYYMVLLREYGIHVFGQMIILEDLFLGQLRLVQHLQTDLQFIILLLKFLFGFEDFHALRKPSGYFLFADAKEILINFYEDGNDCEVDNLLLQKLKYVISTQYGAYNSQYEDIQTARLEQSLAKSFGPSYKTEQYYHDFAKYCLHVVRSKNTESLLTANLLKMEQFSDLRVSESFLMLNTEKCIETEFPLFKNYFMTPQLRCASVYLLHIIDAYCRYMAYNQQVFQIDVYDKALTVEHLMSALGLDYMRCSGPKIPHGQFTVYFISDQDFASQDFFINLSYTNNYGFIFVTYQRDAAKVRELSNRILTIFESYIIININFGVSAATQSAYQVNIAQPAGQDIMKIAQYHLIRVLQLFSGMCVIFRRQNDLRDYAAMLLRQYLKVFKNVAHMYLLVNIIAEEADSVSVFSVASLVELLLASFSMLRYQLLYRNKELSADYIQSYCTIVFYFVVNMPADVPLQCFDILGTECDQQQITQWVQRFQTSYAQVVCNIDYFPQGDNFVLTPCNNGAIVFNSQALEYIASVQFYFRNLAKMYYTVPITVVFYNRLYFEYAFREVRDSVKIVYCTANLVDSLEDVQNSIIASIQRDISRIINGTVKIVVVFSQLMQDDIRIFISALASSNPCKYFSSKFKYRLRSLLQISENDIYQLFRTIFVPIISTEREESGQILNYVVYLRGEPFIPQLAQFYTYNAEFNQLQLLNIDKLNQNISGKPQNMQNAIRREFNVRQAAYHSTFELFIKLNCLSQGKSTYKYKIQLRECYVYTAVYREEMAALELTIENTRKLIHEHVSRMRDNSEAIVKFYYYLDNTNSKLDNIQATFDHVHDYVREAEAEFNAIRRQAISFLKSLSNPPSLARRLLDCLALLLNVKILCVQYYFGELRIEYSDAGTPGAKMLMLQSTYTQDGAIIDAKMLEYYAKDVFLAQKYCYQLGYQIIYCKTPSMISTALQEFLKPSYCDVIHRSQILDNKIEPAKERMLKLTLQFTCPNDSYTLLSDVINNPSFVDRVMGINPAHITDEYLELLLPFIHSPDFNSLTAVQTSHECYSILRWLHSIIRVQQICKVFQPLQYQVMQAKNEISQCQAYIDSLYVINSEYQFYIDHFYTQIKTITEKIHDINKKLITSQGNEALQRVQIEEYSASERNITKYLDRLRANYAFINEDALHENTSTERPKVDLGMQIFDTGENIYDLAWKNQALYAVNLQHIEIKNFFFSSIDPWVSAYLTEDYATQILGLLYVWNTIVLVDKNNHFYIVVARLIQQLNLISSLLRQFQYYAKIDPFYEIESYEIIVFDSLQSFSTYYRNYRNCLFVVYTTEEDLNSAQFQAHIINYDNANQIIFITNKLSSRQLELSVVYFSLSMQNQMYAMSYTDQQITLLNVQLDHACRQYTAFAEMVMCACAENLDLVIITKEKYIQERNNFVAVYRMSKYILKSYYAFGSAIQSLMQLVSPKGDICMSDILKMIAICGRSVKETQKFVDDSKYHETIQTMIIQEIQKHIPITSYAIRYFQMINCQSAQTAYYRLFFEYYFYAERKPDANDELLAELTSKCQKSHDGAARLWLAVTYSQNILRQNALASVMRTHEVFALLAVLSSLRGAQGYHGQLQLLSQKGYLKSGLADIALPEEYYKEIEAFVQTRTELSSYLARWLGNMFALYALGFRDVYHQLVGQPPSLDYRLPPIYYYDPVFSTERDINLSYIIFSRECPLNAVQAVLFTPYARPLNTSTLQLLGIAVSAPNGLDNVQYALEGNPHKLYQTILSIDESVVNGIYLLSAAFSEYIPRQQAEHLLLQCIPPLVLAECLKIYVSQASPFSINQALYLLKVKIARVMVKHHVYTEQLFAIAAPCQINGQVVSIGSVTCKILPVHDKLVGTLLNAVQPIVQRINYPIAIKAGKNAYAYIEDEQDLWIAAVQKQDGELRFNVTLTARHDR